MAGMRAIQKGAGQEIGLRRFLLTAAILLLSAAACGAQNAAVQEDQQQTALALEQQGRNTEAEAAWRSWLEIHPTSAMACTHLGFLEARQEHYEEAIPLYRKALALGSTVPGLRLNLGLAYFKTGDVKDALAEFRTVLKSTPQTSPDRQRLVILVGMCHYGLEQYAEAAPYLKEAVSRDPRNLELLLALEHSYLWSKQYQNVLDTYRAILLVDAESAEADMLAGEALDEMKDALGAIQQFRAAVQADPKMPDVHFGLGYLLWTQKQYTEAAPEFQAELGNNPKHAQALTYLADCDLQQGRRDDAVPLLSKAIQIEPAIVLAHIDLGAIEADAGNRDDALRELTTAAKLAPNDVNVHWRLGRLYRAMGNRQKAQAEFDKAKSITEAANTAVINKMSPHPAQAWTPPPVPAGK
jgi:tetratricopeptide (TPR) repeat protein